jgi:hypothetical protein
VEEGPAGSGSGATFLTQVLEGTPDPHRASLSAPGGDLEGSALDLSSLLRGDAGTTTTAPVTACQEAYETACRQADTVPVARFLHGLGGFECGLAHFGVGPLGMRPIAEALRMNPPLRVLSLADNRITEVWVCVIGCPCVCVVCLCLCAGGVHACGCGVCVCVHLCVCQMCACGVGWMGRGGRGGGE